MFPDFKELLSELNAHRVRYLIVGGYAVGFHGQPRATKDLDLLVSADADNAKALYAALKTFEAPLGGLKPEDLVEPGAFFRMGTPPVMVDILSSIAGVDFEKAWQQRVSLAVDESLTVPVISRADLLVAKLAAGRAVDLADVADLRQLEKSHEAHSADIPERPAQSLEEMQQQAAEKWTKRHSKELKPSPASPGDELGRDHGRRRGYTPDDDHDP